MWVEGTLASADLAGFTRLAERLAALGRAGAEQATSAVNAAFTRLIGIARDLGGDVLSFGGDALLLRFDGPEHAVRACGAVGAMQRTIAEHGHVASSLGDVRLQMSAGVHTGPALVVRLGGRPFTLAVMGPVASRTVALQEHARAGQVGVSAETAALLPPGWTRRWPRVPDAQLLRRDRPAAAPAASARRQSPGPADPEEWLDPAVARQVRAAPGTAEHRAAAIAFIGVDGLDAPLSRGEDDRVVARLDALAVDVQRVCAELGVTWLGLDTAVDGLKLVLVAGVPASSEDDDERLVRAVRRILDAPRGSRALRCGAARGYVFAGDVGHPERRVYTVMGDTVNLAARLMAHAVPGEAVISTGLAGMATTRYALDPLPPLLVRGRREPVAAGRLGVPLGHRPAPFARELVGREREVARVTEIVARARAGRAAALEVVAEGGMGKSHLVHEALRAAGTVSAWGRGDPFGAATAFGAIAPALLGLLGVPEEGRPEERAAALAGRVRAIAPDLVELLPLVADAVRLPAGETAATRDLGRSFRAARLQDTVAALVEGLPPGRVLVLDDAHWADASSRDLARALARGRGTALVVLRRPMLGADPVLGPECTLVLEPLSPGDARRLVLDAAGTRALPDDAIARVLDRAAGHPLFIRQLVGAVQAGVDELPSGVERIVAARIDRLEPSDRTLLREIAVAGRSATRQVLAEALGDPRLRGDGPWRPLGAFVDREGDEVRFRHDLYGEAAYAGLPVGRRRVLHGRIAEALAARGAADDPTLAVHFHRAGRAREALRHARAGARAAGERAAWAEASELLAIVLNCERPGADERLLRADLARSRALELLGHIAQAFDCLAPRRNGASPATRAQRHVRRARLLQLLNRTTAALRETALALKLARTHDGPAMQGIRARALLRRASIRQHQGRPLKALALSREAGRVAGRRDRAEALARESSVLRSLGSPEADEAGRRALRLLRRRRLDPLLGDHLLDLGAFDAWSGRWTQALERYAEALDVYRRTGDAMGAALLLNNRADILVEQGRYDEARSQFADARRMAEAADDPALVACIDASLATIAMRTANHADARRLLEAALTVVRDADLPALMLDNELRQAELSLLEGRPEVALARAAAIRADNRELGFPAPAERWPQQIEAWALLRLGRLDEAEATARAIVDSARSDSAPADVLRGLTTLIALARAAGREPPAAVVAERDALVRQLGVAWLPIPRGPC
jgi:class 3 adenylate cyclase/tetratricopeptide (TPR) repeat protein